MDIITGGIGVDRGRVGGIGARESSKEELAENREPKRLAFSEGETAIEPSVRKRGGKLELQKLVSIGLAKDQKVLDVGLEDRRSPFLCTKERFACRVIDLVRFRAEIKLVWVRIEGEETHV